MSALLAQALQATYWKPIQAGTAAETDTQFVSRVTGGKVNTLPEKYLLREPRSPHAAAAAEGVLIDPSSLTPPTVSTPLIIEGAGGLMVPLTPGYLFADLLQEWKMPVVLVMHTYLGSINHTLLTLEALERRQIPVHGIVINEGGYPESAAFIIARTGCRVLGRVPHLHSVSSESLQQVFDLHFSQHWVS